MPPLNANILSDVVVFLHYLLLRFKGGRTLCAHGCNVVVLKFPLPCFLSFFHLPELCFQLVAVSIDSPLLADELLSK